MEKNVLIERLVIRSFKTIVDQEIPLGLVNVFIGANGSGKSNILEALGVLSAAASGRVDDESLQRRGVRPGVPRLYKSAFSQRRMSPHIFFEADASHAKYSVSLNNPPEKPRPAWQYKTEELISDGNRVVSRGPRVARNTEQGLAALKAVELEGSNPAVQLMDILREYAIYTPNTPTLRGMVPDLQSREPVGLSGGRLANALRELRNLADREEPKEKTERSEKERKVVEFLQDALDEVMGLIDWIVDFDISATGESLLSPSVARPKLVIRFKDRFMRQGKNVLTAYDASEGSLYILFCAVLALSPVSPRCLAIDNLDQTLNPRLTQTLIRALCGWVTDNPYPRQLLFTAHNPAVLDGLPLADDRVRLFAVDRNSQGHTQVRRILITDELKTLSQEKGWPLSRLWVMGHLGGVYPRSQTPVWERNCPQNSGFAKQSFTAK